MAGVLLPNGGRLYGEGMVDPGICGPTGTGVLLPNGGRLYGAEPCGEDPPAPPIFAEAVWWLDATELPDTWVQTDGLPNLGTGLGGDAFGTDGGSLDQSGVYVPANWHPDGVEIPMASAAGSSRYGLWVPDSALFDGNRSMMWTLEFTPLDQSLYEGGKAYLRKIGGSSTDSPGMNMEDITAFNIPGLECVMPLSDDDIPTNSLGVFTDQAPGRHVWIMHIDRETNVLSGWVDGEPAAVPDPDLSGFGDETNNVPLILGQAQVFHRAFIHLAGTEAFADPVAFQSALGFP